MENKKMLSMSIVVRFRDLDALGHVNNAVYLTYFEEGRIAFSNLLLGHVKDASAYHFIQAHVSCDYVRPIKINDRISLNIWVKKIGKASFTFEILLQDRANPDLIYAKGESVMVHYDFTTGQSVPLTEEHRQFLSQYLISQP